jgi:hypothetical protein
MLLKAPSFSVDEQPRVRSLYWTKSFRRRETQTWLRRSDYREIEQERTFNRFERL